MGCPPKAGCWAKLIVSQRFRLSFLRARQGIPRFEFDSSLWHGSRSRGPLRLRGARGLRRQQRRRAWLSRVARVQRSTQRNGPRQAHAGSTQ